MKYLKDKDNLKELWVWSSLVLGSLSLRILNKNEVTISKMLMVFLGMSLLSFLLFYSTFRIVLWLIMKLKTFSKNITFNKVIAILGAFITPITVWIFIIYFVSNEYNFFRTLDMILWTIVYLYGIGLIFENIFKNE